VIYSSSDRHSFVIAERILQTLWTSENIAQKAVILVGNKADLARSRSVSTEGKILYLKQSWLHLSFLTTLNV
jgi:Rad and Gem related GTP binding protein 1